MAAEIFELEITPARVYLQCPFVYKAVCQAVPGGRWEPESKRWHWPADSIAAAALLDAFGPKVAKLPGADGLRSLAGRDGAFGVFNPDEIPDGDLPEIPGLKGESWQHQKAGYQFAMRHAGALLPFYMGYGKSRVAVGLVANRICRGLIMCPKSVVPVWPREFEKHLRVPDGVKVVPLDKGSVADKVKVAQRAIQATRFGYTVVLVVNYESAWREPFATWALKAGFDTLILDEGHKIKSAGGKASRFCARLGAVCAFRLGLSGTPMPHSPLDIYGLYRTLNPRIFGTNFHQFKTRYAILGGFENRSVIGYQRTQELHDKIKSIALFVPDNLLDLPPAMDVTIPIELSPAAQRILRQLERDFYAELDAGEITAGNALVKLLRQQQVTSGCVKLDDGSTQLVDAGKRHALEDLLEGMGDEPVVVFTRFTSDLDAVLAVSAALDLQYRELSGRANSLAEWQSGDGQVLGVNIQAGGAGIDLTRARYCVYFSLGFSLGDYMQSRARVHRPGQERPVTYYHLVAENTVDSKVYAALAARQEVVDYIIKGVDFCPALVENE